MKSSAARCDGPSYNPVTKVYVACDGAGEQGSDVVCFDQALVPQPPDSDPVWAGVPRKPNNPTGPRIDGTIVLRTCVTGGDPATTTRTRLFVRLLQERRGAADLAAEVIAALPIPVPVIGVGPNREQVAVNVPVSLWVGNADPIAASASDGPLTVTVSATIASVTWSMGEPLELERPLWLTPSFTCAGAGSPVARDARTPTTCAYTYRWRSLPDRTHGTEHWPVTASAAWSISWVSTSGLSGSDTVTRAAATELYVGEWKSNLSVPTR